LFIRLLACGDYTGEQYSNIGRTLDFMDASMENKKPNCNLFLFNATSNDDKSED